MTDTPPTATTPFDRPQGLDSPLVPKIIKLASRRNVGVYRATGGRIGGKWRIGSAFPAACPSAS
ncbi:hypothetical protein OG920_39515 [Streptomyces europaeiscabiei]|uniref:hypothetical protein n=1 Tax=Streptomyces europaeiscabiei TaxID=146819 RepID=UPI002E189F3B|nr:hypothetical protein OG858_40240 [Streptomyces europaeiscabiei]